MNSAALPHLFQEELYQFNVPMVVVVSRPWSSYTADEHQLLKKILSSVKIDISSVTMLTRTSLQLEDLNAYGPAKVLVFGSELPADVPMYENTAAHAFSVIRADDLTALDDQKKKNLWLALRQMFGI